MKILKIGELMYSRDEFDGYKFRGVFDFYVGHSEPRKITIYTTDTDKANVLNVLNEKKTHRVISISLSHWCSKEQYEKDTAFILSVLNFV